MWEVSLLEQILVFCSLQSPAEALLGSGRILREILPSPLFFAFVYNEQSPGGAWGGYQVLEPQCWVESLEDGFPAWLLSWILAACSHSMALCAPLLLSPHRAEVPPLSQPSFSNMLRPWEKILISIFYSPCFQLLKIL